MRDSTAPEDLDFLHELSRWKRVSLAEGSKRALTTVHMTTASPYL